jgi:hypothetical protein
MALIRAGSLEDFSLTPTGATKADPNLPAFESFSTLSQAARGTPADRVEFAESTDPRGLTLRRLRLEPGFQGFIKEMFNASADIYFLAWGWDLSGKEVQGSSTVFFYPGVISGGQPTLIPLKGSEEREFIGAGIPLYPQRKITSGLAVRLQIWNSRKGERDLGETLQKVATEIQRSQLNQLLTLVSVATGVTGATLTLVEQASLELTKLIGTILKARSDDYVDYYEGYFPVSEPWIPPDQSWHAQASEITLGRI